MTTKNPTATSRPGSAPGPPPSSAAPDSKPGVDGHDETACVVVRDLLARVGDKWSVLAITLLGERTYRFSELSRSIDGISQRMLALTLRQLERDGLVRREAFAEVPPRVEYSLTPLGRSVLDPITALASWAQDHGGDVADARRSYDAANNDS